MPSPERRRFRPVVVTLLAGVVVGALALALRLKGAVETAVAPPESATVPFDLAPLAEPSILLPVWGSEDITAVVEMPDALYVAGDFGVARLRPQAQEALFEREDLSRALPTRRATALTRWRSRLVAALDAGGLFVREEGAWKELRSALGTLHVRALQESPAGELWIGAREGLFRIAFGEMGLTRRHAKPVRALALVEGGKVLSGGEQGAFETSGPDTAPLKLQGVQTPWIDALAASSGRAVAIGPE